MGLTAFHHRSPRRTVVALANAAVAVAACIALAPAAQAGDQFGSIAYSPSGKLFGRTKDAPSRAAADSGAMSACGKSDCQVLVSFSDCAAVAENNAGDHAGGYGTTLAAAEQDAMKRLGTAGWIGTWLCN